MAFFGEVGDKSEILPFCLVRNRVRELQGRSISYNRKLIFKRNNRLQKQQKKSRFNYTRPNTASGTKQVTDVKRSDMI